MPGTAGFGSRSARGACHDSARCRARRDAGPRGRRGAWTPDSRMLGDGRGAEDSRIFRMPVGVSDRFGQSSLLAVMPILLGNPVASRLRTPITGISQFDAHDCKGSVRRHSSSWDAVTGTFPAARCQSGRLRSVYRSILTPHGDGHRSCYGFIGAEGIKVGLSTGTLS